MTTTTDIHRFVPVSTCLAAMQNATPEQLAAIERLVQKPTVQKMTVSVDIFSDKYLTFALIGNKGPDDVFLVGLIEPDGSVNT